MTDYVRQKGTAAFGTRLRRLSDRLDRQVLAVYREHDSAFQPRWFAVVGALREKQGLTVGELAALLGITHAAVSQLRGELVAAGLVRAKADPADGRRQLLELSPNGKRAVARLEPLWAAIGAATSQLVAGAAPRLLDDIGKLEAALDETELAERVRAVLARSS
ncbi:MAG: MarR family transcriptional regulator [Rhizomicrobium sp.]